MNSWEDDENDVDDRQNAQICASNETKTKMNEINKWKRKQ